jgi:hypothetical protein
VNGAALPNVQLDIILSLVVKGLILKIRDGKVREVTAGSIMGRGRLETAGLTILEKQTEEVLLPRRRKVKELSTRQRSHHPNPSGGSP